MSGRDILLAVKPRWTDLILARTKLIELRRAAPKDIGMIADTVDTFGYPVYRTQHVYLYSSAPDSAILGRARLTQVSVMDVDAVWRRIDLRRHTAMGEREFRRYCEGVEQITCLHLCASSMRPFRVPVSLARLRELIRGFTAPQSFRYLDVETAAKIFEEGTR